MVKDDLTDLRGSSLLQNEFENTLCETDLKVNIGNFAGHRRRVGLHGRPAS
jgi:hypothetical protein